MLASRLARPESLGHLHCSWSHCCYPGWWFYLSHFPYFSYSCGPIISTALGNSSHAPTWFSWFQLEFTWLMTGSEFCFTGLLLECWGTFTLCTGATFWESPGDQAQMTPCLRKHRNFLNSLDQWLRVSRPASCSNWANTSLCFPNVSVDNYCSALLVPCCLPVYHCFHTVCTWASRATDTEAGWMSAQGWEMLGGSGPFLCLWPAGRGWEGELLRWGRVDLTSSRVQALGLLSPTVKSERWITLILFSVIIYFQFTLWRTSLVNDTCKPPIWDQSCFCVTDIVEQRLTKVTKLFWSWYAVIPAHFQPWTITTSPPPPRGMRQAVFITLCWSLS